MTRNVGTVIENNFTKGLISEATGLNFPENACVDTDNCVFTQTGVVSRRLGFDLEPAYSVQTLDKQMKAFSNFLWTDVGGDGNLSIQVIQVGPTLYFYVLANFSLSGGLHSDTIDLTDFTPAGGDDPDFNECQFSIGNGDLVVSHPDLESFYIVYDAENDTIAGVQIDKFIRDFEGDPTDSLEVNERPTSTYADLSDAHHYNLFNQGWTDTNLTAWDTARTDMPANSDQMWRYKNADDEYDVAVAAEVIPFVGNTPAPKGHFILNLYEQDRNTASGLSTVPTTSSGTKRASTNAFFAGRIFYSGVNAPGYVGKVFFSQIIESREQYGFLYQANDPTSEFLFDLLPSDGGVINIQEAGSIYKLFAAENALLVFASNGIWHISGSQGIGFAANDYTVTKISSTNAISATSFVDVTGYPIWWNSEGIHALTPGQQGLAGFKVETLTDNTIKEIYNEIPLASKRLARGSYDPIQKRIQWLYKAGDTGDLSEAYEFDSLMTLNTITGAFYPWSVSTATTDVRLHGITFVQATGGSTTVDQVVVGADNVVDDAVSEDNVIVFSVANPGISTPKFKYLISIDNGVDYDITFAETWNTDYLDWVSYEGTGIDFESYFLTGYKSHGEAQRKWQSNYIWLYCDNDTPSSFRIKGQWDFANSGNTGRWTSEQQITFEPSDYDYRSKKIKIRGHGKTLQYRVGSVSGQPFNIVGWSVFESANAVP